MEAFDRLGPRIGQVEVSGLAVDRDNDMVWMSDWVDGRYLYGYDLKTGKYVRKVHLRPVPQWQQGIFMVDGRMLISADDGECGPRRAGYDLYRRHARRGRVMRRRCRFAR